MLALINICSVHSIMINDKEMTMKKTEINTQLAELMTATLPATSWKNFTPTNSGADFEEVAVWSLKDCLIGAFKLGAGSEPIDSEIRKLGRWVEHTSMGTWETLETRNSDELDFHEVAVWQMEAWMTHAYHLGKLRAEVGY